MDEPAGDRGTTRQQALRDRYPAGREAQDREAQEELRALRRGLRDLSDVVINLAAYLSDISAQADAGNTGQEPRNREQLQVLREEATAIWKRLAEERP